MEHGAWHGTWGVGVAVEICAAEISPAAGNILILYILVLEKKHLVCAIPGSSSRVYPL